MSRNKSSSTSPPSDLAAAYEQIRSLRAQLVGAQAQVAEAGHEARCFRELAEHIQEVFWMTNPMGDELIYISPAYEHIWGQPCAGLYEDPGRRLAWVYEDDRERVLIAFKRDAADGHYDETFRINRPDGEIRWIRDRAFPVRDASGEVYRLAGLATDLTDDIENQDRKAAFKDLIAKHERASGMTNGSAELAHAMAQPLTSTLIFVSRALSITRSEDSEQIELLEGAQYQLQRAAAMIHRLRESAREGRPTPSQQALFSMLSEVRELFELRLRAERISLQWPADDELVAIELSTDGMFAQQALRNLINNAIDALAHSSVAANERRITLTVDNDHDDQLDIYVADTGGGIAEDVELFAPLATTKRDGLGLGLSMSRSLARSHGGDLWLINHGRDDSGLTCFMLRLPRKIAGAA